MSETKEEEFWNWITHSIGIALTLGGSEFENDLVNHLCDELVKSNLQAAQKLLICLVCDRFDDFEGVMSKVRLTYCGQVLQTLFTESLCENDCRRNSQ